MSADRSRGRVGAGTRFYLAASLVLLPILIAQGIVARRSVPRLQEPPGPREGETGDGPPLRLLILGDSAAAGVGATHQDEALLGQLVKRLSAHFRLTWSLKAKNGHTTAEVLAWLDSEPPREFDIAVTSLGVNDVTSLVGIREWRRQQARLRTVLKRRFGVDRLIISGLPPLHAFPALPQPLRWCLGARATEFNRELADDLALDITATFLDLRFTADTSLMAIDGYHPGPGIYAQWSERVAEIITSN